MFSSYQISKLIQFFILPILFIDFLILIFKESYSLISLNMFITTLILPTYLTVKYVRFIRGHKNKFLPVNIFFMLITVWFGIFLTYAFWGITSGLLFRPDGETVAILYCLVIISSGIILFGSVGAHIYKLIKK